MCAVNVFSRGGLGHVTDPSLRHLFIVKRVNSNTNRDVVLVKLGKQDLVL